MQILGVDIGGSGIKGAIVDTAHAALATERIRIATPRPATPDAVAAALASLVSQLAWDGPIGCGFPAVVMQGTIRTAANIPREWIGLDAERLFTKSTGLPVTVLNDADAAGIAEMDAGNGRGESGVVVLITIGTGLGSALFVDGRLVHNTELGHVQLHGDIAESYASDAARKREDLSWTKWARRFNEYLQHIELLLSPDVFIIGGGASKRFEKWSEHLALRARVLPALLRNEAGIVGAALAARRQSYL